MRGFTPSFDKTAREEQDLRQATSHVPDAIVIGRVVQAELDFQNQVAQRPEQRFRAKL